LAEHVKEARWSHRRWTCWGWLRKHPEAADNDLLREMVLGFVQALMSAEADAACGAALGERSAERVNQRNGYRERRLDTRVGTLELAIPKLRQGSYYPDWLLEPRRRAERALVAVVAEGYVRGVSTRRVEGLVQTLGIRACPSRRSLSWPRPSTVKWPRSGLGRWTLAPMRMCGWTRWRLSLRQANGVMVS
jgi:Transposase, Mutator family